MIAMCKSGTEHDRKSFVLICLADADIIFLPCGFYLSFSFLSFFTRLISAVADWMSIILPHMVWP